MASVGDTKPTRAPEFGEVLGTAELDDALYDLDEAEIKFIIEQTGLKDPGEVKEHLLRIQHEVYSVYPYPCVRLFHFAKPKIVRSPVYNELLRLGKDRPGALFLDVGCGVGCDTRKPVADGFPASQVVAVDLKPDFWEIGHQVFKSTPETFPVKFMAGDVFDDSFLKLGPIAAESLQNQGPVDLSSQTTLTSLRGRFSAIHASFFFHLFSEEQQTELAHRLRSLLSPEPGSIIFGIHIGRPEKGLRIEDRGPNQRVRIFGHSPESWNGIWDDAFGGGKVEANAFLQKRAELKPLTKYEANYLLVWSVKRL